MFLFYRINSIYNSLVQVVQYLAGCGLQSCVMLVHKGYPDIGWNPVEGERYLDFLRFAVFCNGKINYFIFKRLYSALTFLYCSFKETVEVCIFCCKMCLCVSKMWPGESVEENANVVVRLLIRRPECFGPALRGEGGDGLLAAMEEAIKISQDPTRDGPSPMSESSKAL